MAKLTAKIPGSVFFEFVPSIAVWLIGVVSRYVILIKREPIRKVFTVAEANKITHAAEAPWKRSILNGAEAGKSF